MANALRYTPPESQVTLRLAPAPEPRHAEIAVIDHGPGLSDEQSARVFERFYRADSARTRRLSDADRGTSGTGLGLAIVAALVKAHGGTVEVRKTPGSGATFVVVLPLAPEAVNTDTSVMP
jgi:two-component system OmpR family sensor kinase